MHDTNKKKHVENESQENSIDREYGTAITRKQQKTANFSELYVVSNLKEKMFYSK